MLSRRNFFKKTCSFVCCCGLGSFPKTALGQDQMNFENVRACGADSDVYIGNVWTFESSDEAKNIVKEICDAVGLAQNFEIRAASIQNNEDVANAVAFVSGIGTDQFRRYILYNEDWVRDRLRASGEKYWSGVALLAHECGHHLNGHTLDGQGSRPAKELEADSFAGFAVAKLGGSLDEAQALFRTFGGAGSQTHPARNDRLQAVAVGFRRAGPSREENQPKPSTPQVSDLHPDCADTVGIEGRSNEYVTENRYSDGSTRRHYQYCYDGKYWKDDYIFRNGGWKRYKLERVPNNQRFVIVPNR